MRLIQVFDPALCCSSGVCGAEVDQALVTFAGDAEWIKQQGASLFRFNLAQQPLVFAETPAVASFLELSGEEGLPVTLVDGQVVLTGRYPSRAELMRYAGLESQKAADVDCEDVEQPAVEPNKAGAIKGIVKSGCCSGSSGCC
ncbi:arsenical resistance operon transcriptional repressor ArsD [Aeromonas allosaccharophila]|uniref:arsenite efflux transporter metallochaperone ArsD n=1 Tax=Aeromonas allosaccharophila TaxID=656 RepID=UPI0005B20697|nr:arsenite efflux transporter metallochaperone ArsD [Aeromonas allosaccharophila]OKP42330.1 arsenical resistance operon transcriptional repressor ArsD [Aeromonas allosaccharophila]